MCRHCIRLLYPSSESREGAVRVRTDKANFEPSLVGHIFSVQSQPLYPVYKYRICLDQSELFQFFCETAFKATSKLANLPWETLKFWYNWPRSIYQYSSMARSCRSKIANFFNSLCLSIPKIDLGTKKTTPNIEVCPESLGTML